MNYIVKRDGREVPFNQNKIIDAVLSAFKEVDGELTDYAYIKAGNIADYIEEEAEQDKNLTVEDIQDLVEKGLMATKRKDVAKAYILYRENRTRERNKNSELLKRVDSHLNAKNVLNQNANMDEYSFGGRRGEAANALMKQYALDYCMSEMARNNHLNNEIYIHDLDSYAVGMHNCLTIPFDELLAKGFNTRQTDIRPANSINTAFQLIAVVFQLQSLQQFGGVSASHLDWTMIPYVRRSFYKHYKNGMEYICNSAEWNLKNEMEDNNIKDITEIAIDDYSYYHNLPDDCADFDKVYKYALNMTKKELQQAVEGMYHNLNTLQSRSGNQLPFTSINYGTCTLPEGRMVTQALLEGSIKGVGKHHRTPIFPCGIFQCMKGINRKPGEPNYDLYRLALKSTSKRLYPNYVNVDWSNNAGYDREDPTTYVSTMGCRTYNGADINAETGVNPQRKDGRGNIAPTTIIMPTLAMKAKEACTKNDGYNKSFITTEYKITNSVTGDVLAEGNALIDKFMNILDTKIHEAKDMLIERYNWICSQNPDSAKFMYENGTMFGYDGKTIESAMKHGTLVIGQLGLAETLQILIGEDQTSAEGMKLAKKIEQLFKDRCAEFKKEYHLNFGVYYTPKLLGLGVA